MKAAKPILEAIVPGMADKIAQGMPPQEAAKEAMKENQENEQKEQEAEQDLADKKKTGSKGKEFTKADAQAKDAKAKKDETANEE